MIDHRREAVLHVDRLELVAAGERIEVDLLQRAREGELPDACMGEGALSQFHKSLVQDSARQKLRIVEGVLADAANCVWEEHRPGAFGAVEDGVHAPAEGGPGDEDVRDLELALFAEPVRDVVHQGESVARGQLRSFGLGPGGDRGAVRTGVNALLTVP